MRAVFGSLVLLCALGACDKEAPADADASKETPDAKKDEPKGAFSTYKAKSMASEAKVNVGRIVSAVQFAFQEERVVPGSMEIRSGMLPPSTPMTPAAGACCKQPQGTCAPDMGDWAQEGWKLLNFAPSGPHRYSYEIVADEKSVTIRAQGDLDCDGELSTYEAVGTVVDGALQFAPALTETAPLE